MPQLRRLANREGQPDYDIKWRWVSYLSGGGFTAVFWVRNEVPLLPYVLPPLLRAVDRVIVIDNGSIDGWDVAQSITSDDGTPPSLRVVDYPFELALPGDPHLGTPPDSVHSRAYARNWALSLVETPYVLEWAGDVVLTAAGEEALLELSWRQESHDAIIEFPCSTLIAESEKEAVLRKSSVDTMAAWPNKKGVSIGKGMDQSIVQAPPRLPHLRMPDFLCFRVGWADPEAGTGAAEGSGTGGTKRPSRLTITASDGEHVIEAAQRAPRSHWSRRRAG